MSKFLELTRIVNETARARFYPWPPLQPDASTLQHFDISTLRHIDTEFDTFAAARASVAAVAALDPQEI
jgi:hypothetical protein